MQTVKELTVVLKGEDKTYREKFLIYDDMQLCSDDPVIKDCINKAQANCKGPHEEVRLKISMEV